MVFFVILPARASWANIIVNGANNTNKPRSDEMKWWRPYLELETRYCLLQLASGPEIIQPNRMMCHLGKYTYQIKLKI